MSIFKISNDIRLSVNFIGISGCIEEDDYFINFDIYDEKTW